MSNIDVGTRVTHQLLPNMAGTVTDAEGEMVRIEWDTAGPAWCGVGGLLRLCAYCDNDGELKPATDGDLCASCHDSAGAAQDARAAEGT